MLPHYCPIPEYSKIQSEFDIRKIEKCLEKPNTKGRAILLDLMNALSSIGLDVKEISHNQWIVTHITPQQIKIVDLNLPNNSITIDEISLPTHRVDFTGKVFSSWVLWNVCTKLEEEYRMAKVKIFDHP